MLVDIRVLLGTVVWRYITARFATTEAEIVVGGCMLVEGASNLSLLDKVSHLFGLEGQKVITCFLHN